MKVAVSSQKARSRSASCSVASSAASWARGGVSCVGVPRNAQACSGATTTLHFLHGDADDIFPAAELQQAFDHLARQQGDATLDIAHGVGHELHPALVDRALFRLRNHIPLRTWQAALGASPAVAADTD